MKPELHILAPDLPQHLVAAPADPAATRLARLLARGDWRLSAGVPYECELARRCGIAYDERGSPPFAAVTAQVDFEQPPTGLLRADPVWLRADASRLFLFEPATLALEAAEADALLAELNAAFGDAGPRLRRGAAVDRWYLEGAALPAAPALSPQRLGGRALEPDFASFAGLGTLKRLLTEAQMVLHASAVNEARAASGRPPVNSIWPWGGGTPSRPRPAPLAALASDDELALACAAWCGAATCSEPAALATCADPSGADLAMACAPGGPLGAPPAFLREVLEPALALLADGRIRAIVITAGPLRVSLGPRARWRAWRRPGALVAACRAAVETA